MKNILRLIIYVWIYAFIFALINMIFNIKLSHLFVGAVSAILAQITDRFINGVKK